MIQTFGYDSVNNMAMGNPLSMCKHDQRGNGKSLINVHCNEKALSIRKGNQIEILSEAKMARQCLAKMLVVST
jgi:hypothetical protein